MIKHGGLLAAVFLSVVLAIWEKYGAFPAKTIWVLRYLS
jgi:hypothetical protein